MKIVIDPKNFREVLARFNSAFAQVWLFNVTHKKLALRLSLPNLSEVIYIVGIGCDHIKGPLSWKGSRLRIVEDKGIQGSELITRIVDDKSGFELICSGGVTLASGKDTDVDTSFEGFLGDDHYRL